MFDSGIAVSALVSGIRDEADISMPIDNMSYVIWINALEQLLYTELIGELGTITLPGVTGNMIDINSLDVPECENAIRFEDIYAIYAGAKQLIKSTAVSGVLFPNTFYKINNNIGLNLDNPPNDIRIIYVVRPALKTIDDCDTITGNVMLPVEFIDLARAKLRGEAYKIANEDALAAKWLNDYNVLLETFKVWIAGKQSDFGL